METHRILSRHERGQALIIIALLMMGMIALLGLVLDGGQTLVVRRQSQNAADAAAFAGVRVLAIRTSTTTESDIWNSITTFAQANGVASADVTAYLIDQSGTNICRLNSNCGGIPSSPYPTGVRVTTTLYLQPYFISVIIGKAPIPIQSVAAAQSGNPSIASQLAPMSLPFPCSYVPNDPEACTLNYGQSYQLQGNSQLSGGFQWVDWSGGASSQNIVDYLSLKVPGPSVMADKDNTYIDPATPRPTPSPWVPSGPGVQPNSQIETVLDAWLDLTKWGVDSHINWGSKPADSKWTVPVFNTGHGTGNNAEYHVVMFAEFQVQGYWFANNQCNWIGKTSSEHCNKVSDLPPALQTCAQTQDPNAPPGEKMKCIMGQFLREVTSLQTTPGKCNSSGLNACGYGLSQ